MAIVIREAGPEDTPVIAVLIRELAEAVGESSSITETHVGEYLSFPGSHVLLAEEECQPIGLLSYAIRPNLYHAGNCALIEELVVTVSHRSRGVGGVLVSELLKRLAAAGCAEVSVSTMPGNEGARRFYRSHGFVDEYVYLERHFA
jgi:GNAT superfamily N-acetyltransferase